MHCESKKNAIFGENGKYKKLDVERINTQK